ncbi:flagellar assembly protein FliH [Paenisporosarcina cavernae]|uniref:Flagellar assembly protein FliH n=1 Tax=Paenisporosarcina cavernae TaxID=2320858 RepID=A0A385YS88_9BACL|nr:flagellar assembly protein FliH [Paenisporosarcina cavernae]
MSRIIRPIQTNSQEENSRAIQLKKLFVPPVNEAESELTLSQVMAERERLLSDASEQIETEKNNLEWMKSQAIEEIQLAKQAWEDEKLQLQQRAYEEGFAQGYEEGLHKATSDMANDLREANETMLHTHENAKKYIAEQEHVILDLALKSAERILGHALDQNDEEFLAIVKRGLKEAREMKEIKLYVSPKYHDLVSSNYDDLSAIFPVNVPFMIFVNEDLQDKQSYIETNHGRIVIGIDAQLNELRLKLSELLDSKE